MILFESKAAKPMSGSWQRAVFLAVPHDVRPSGTTIYPNPRMKGNAVRDVMQHVGKIQDRVERLEVAKAVAEGFRVPEAIIFEQLSLAPGRSESEKEDEYRAPWPRPPPEGLGKAIDSCTYAGSRGRTKH